MLHESETVEEMRVWEPQPYTRYIEMRCGEEEMRGIEKSREFIVFILFVVFVVVLFVLDEILV